MTHVAGANLALKNPAGIGTGAHRARVTVNGAAAVAHVGCAGRPSA